ncbi:MAG: Small-conductance mechanosensitive channel [Thermococcales archaeon 44_46]|uniref:mechanosensitive ion channel family protein n=1 Tax=Thermococcus TaxID=2263 RepID=UPI0005B2CFF8|nr:MULTISPECIES: mechanosensitive ion channel family protein [Thermococcus]KUJ99823.1 MAG: Small-conductance mechanosensitive channel [Thermococcales archaeon 44_46]MCA6213939.1 mechanosensitive ion channel family protein [Thermococcus bergensis]HIH72269.1 mechanosensitive ion channel family protein [Thermococcaceae archaeon]
MVILDKPLPYVEITPLQIITAVIVLIVGFVVAKIIVASFKRGLQKTKLPGLVIEFLARFLSALLYVVVILLAVRALGVNVGSVVLGLSAVIGLILGFGMQDTLTNLAAGVWLAALRPFDKGDVVTIAGQTGKVEAVGVMSTELLTADNVLITIPNKLVWGNVITNYTRMPTRRVDVNVGVAYGTDLDKAIKVAMDLMKNHPKVLKEPEPAVVITGLGDSSINLQLRAWAKTEDYWAVKGDLTKGIYEAYRREDIEIPFPQMDVHIKEMPKL